MDPPDPLGGPFVAKVVGRDTLLQTLWGGHLLQKWLGEALLQKWLGGNFVAKWLGGNFVTEMFGETLCCKNVWWDMPFFLKMVGGTVCCQNGLGSTLLRKWLGGCMYVCMDVCVYVIIHPHGGQGSTHDRSRTSYVTL